MKTYRIVVIGDAGTISRRRDFVCMNDEDAIVWAKHLESEKLTEVWTGARFIARIEPKSVRSLSGSTMNARPEFRLVCDICDSVGILLDYPEGAPPSTLIRCSICSAPRGTLGALRNLANSDRQN